MSESSASDYALETETVSTVAAPDLPYRPPRPKRYRPKIGLIGCGGISPFHLKAYREMGLEIGVLCDKNLEKARSRRDEFFPEASIGDDPYEIIGREDLEVLDLTPHPEDRLPLICAALEAGKHVLSQKPLVLDLDEGERLCDLAQQKGVRLAVNQNGRWAPHFSYIREAVRTGIIGEVLAVHTSVHWDHTWTAGTPFEEIEDLVLYDFGIHWFDFLASLVGSRALRVQASRSFAAGQTMKPPMLAQVLVELEGGQASLIFDAHLKYGPQDRTYVGGSQGSLTSLGPDLGNQRVELYTAAGKAVPTLEGHWFQQGFQGTMGELLCAIEEHREPLHNARHNLQSLALCFAAIAAAREGTAKRPGQVRRL
jgi:predicted dehydrogenase